MIKLDEPIKTLGEYQIKINVHTDVTASVSLQVVKEE
jgi:ribosomal protein L9